MSSERERVWRSMVNMLAPEAQKIVWEGIRESSSRLPPAFGAPRDMAPLIQAGVACLPPEQRDVAEQIARKVFDIRSASESGEWRALQRLEGYEEDRDNFRHILDAEETLRMALGRALGKVAESPEVNAVMELLTRYARGLYKARHAALGHQGAVRSAADGAARFFREGAFEELALDFARGVAGRARQTREKRGFVPASFAWAEQMADAAEKLSKQPETLRGEGLGEFARQWTQARFEAPDRCDKYLSAPINTWRDMADKRALETAQFRADHEEACRLEAKIEAEIKAAARLLNSPAGIAAFGDIDDPEEAIRHALGLTLAVPPDEDEQLEKSLRSAVAQNIVPPPPPSPSALEKTRPHVQPATGAHSERTSADGETVAYTQAPDQPLDDSSSAEDSGSLDATPALGFKFGADGRPKG